MSKIEELFGDRIKENEQNFGHENNVETEREIEIKRIDKILVIGLMLMTLIIPLIVRAHFTDFISPQVTGTDLDSGSKTDIFTYYKFVLLIIGTSILSIVFLYKVFGIGYVIPKSKINIFAGIFFVMVILSAMFAPNKTLALVGMYNRHDGTISYLCYTMLFFIAANIKYSPKMISLLTYILVPFILINATLGLFIIYGVDVFKWGWVNNLIFGNLPEGSNVNAGSQLWSTFNNPNYISGFAGTLTSLFFTLAVMKRNIGEKAVFLLISFASFSMILTSLSTNGFLAFFVTVPLTLIIALISKSKGRSLSFFVIGIIGFALTLNILATKNPRIWTESLGFIISENPFVEVQQTAKSVLDFDLESSAFAAEQDFTMKELPQPGLSAGSGRIYIWEKSLELIKDKPLLGYGLDTFVYHFPQNDVNKISGLGVFNIITDKPHNLFIGLAYGSGIVSAVSFALLAVFLLFKWAVGIFRKRLGIETIAIGMMIVAFLIQSMFNDSIIGFTNVIIVFIGVLAANLININKDESLGEE